jgi:hypothetical protein
MPAGPWGSAAGARLSKVSGKDGFIVVEHPDTGPWQGDATIVRGIPTQALR